MAVPVVAAAGGTFAKGALAAIGSKLAEPVISAGVEIGMDEIRNGIKDMHSKNKQIEKEKTYEFYHNFIVFDTLRTSNGSIPEIFSKYLLHLIDEGETRESLTEMLKYLANKKPNVYNYVGEDIADLTSYHQIMLKPRPSVPLDMFITNYKAFLIRQNLNMLRLKSKYGVKNSQVCFILFYIENTWNFQAALMHKEYLIDGDVEGALSKI